MNQNKEWIGSKIQSPGEIHTARILLGGSMKNTFLLFAVPVALLSLGLAQAPAPVAMTLTAANIKGCLGGSDGAYSVAQDGSTQTFKITASSVDLKPHIGHQVELTGQKSSAAVFGSADTISVTGVTMIAEHCPMTAASAPAPADPTTATLSAPAAAAAAPAPTATAPVETPVAAKPAEVVAAPVVAPAATTAPEPVAAATPAQAASAPVVMAGAKESLLNTAAPSLKAVKVTGNVGADGKTFVSDKDSKSWTVANPDAVKGHEGHHVTLTAQLDTVKSEVNIVSLKMAK
jgi:hypothetical protein